MQRDYPKIKYPSRLYPNATVASSGCGPTCASMVVETLTGKRFPPEQAAAFALECGARVSTGTDMAVLAKALARAFGLTVRHTNSVTDLPAALKRGAIAIANVGGDRSGYKGVFSDGGHYVVVLGLAPDGRLMLADPGFYAGKYQKPHRKAVEVAGNLLYAPPQVLDKDAQNRNPRYLLFGV